MTKKRILVYCVYLEATGGIESHILEFCKQMSANGIRIDFWVSNFLMSARQKKELEACCENLYLIHVKNKWSRAFWLAIYGLFLRFRKYDSLYTNGQNDSILFIKYLLGKQLRWVHHHHTSGDEKDQKSWSSIYTNTLLKADRVVACSDTNASNMARRLNRNIDVVYYFSRELAVKDSAYLEREIIKLGYMGRLVPEKGINIICKLSQDEDCRGISFHIWGAGEGYDHSFFEKYDNVNYYGSYDSQAGLERAVSLIDGMLLLSTHPEGLPVSLLEVMSAGLPWLATDRGGIKDIACDQETTRVISHLSDYETFKFAVIQFAKDIKSGAISSEKQRQLYQEHFSASVVSNKWFEILAIK